MDTLHIAVCEDLESERTALLKLLEQNEIPKKIDIFVNGEDFLHAFEPYRYDLLLMDILMGGKTGIDVISHVRRLDTQVSVAFVTSSLDYALESYRLEALKYIEKPAQQKAVDEILRLAMLKKQDVPSLLLQSGTTSHTIAFSRILYLEQKGRSLLVHLVGGEVVSINKKLTDIEAVLPADRFLRCHKSFIVNLGQVQSLDKELLVFQMREGDNVYIRRESFWQVKKVFETYLFTRIRGQADAD